MEKYRGNRIKLYLLRAFLTLLCVLTFALIFSNSLRSGEASSEQSYTVTDAVQSAAGVIAPESSVANATGEAYEKLHTDVRTLAHFSEFALLGALLIWCYFSYTKEKKYLIAPIGVLFLTPITDEWLQSFSSGRAAELSDVFVDTLGGLCGVFVALLALAVGYAAFVRRKRKKRIGI